ncbi:MAG: S-layer homology domain-containing protein [Syntrophomonadaceae bacterium]
MKVKWAFFMTSCLIAVFLMLGASPAGAVPPDFAGGVANEYKYQEMVFLTGVPIKFSGTIKQTEKVKGDLTTLTYDFTLTPEDKSITGKFSRKMSYKISSSKDAEVGQTLTETEVGTFKESITINGVKYDLKDLQFYKSDAIDNRPASDYYSGSVQARKTYVINKNQGEVIVDISGGDVGYNNFWGSTQTQVLDYNISQTRTIEATKTAQSQKESWQGTVKVTVSDSTDKSLQYNENLATLSSFNGSYTRVTRGEMASQYSYDLPTIIEGVADDTQRNIDQVSLNMEKVPKVEKLLIPKFRDTGGHWAEDYIGQLFSLGVFEGDSKFFAPDAPISRMDFIRALVRICDIRANQAEDKKKTSKKAPAEVSPFTDVPTSSTDYQYVKAAVEKGLTIGVSDSLFGADLDVDRAQAIHMLIKALGFEDKVPTPGFSTSFADEDQIPIWCFDSVYVAAEIGLISGDSTNRLNSQKVMTRGEASAMLVRFLKILQSDLQKDYRENIVLFN